MHKKEVMHIRELEHYVMSCLDQGYTESKIHSTLTKGGWSETIIRDVFIRVNKTFNNEIEFRKRKERAKKLKDKKGHKYLLRIKDLMTKKVMTCSKNDSIANAAKVMDVYNFGSLIVVDRGKPIGIVTERDILRKVVASNLNIKNTKVEDVMTTELITAGPDARIVDIATMMKSNNIKRIPIVKKGKLQGIISSTELVKIMAYI